jgi:hypothetical protein
MQIHFTLQKSKLYASLYKGHITTVLSMDYINNYELSSGEESCKMQEGGGYLVKNQAQGYVFTELMKN